METDYSEEDTGMSEHEIQDLKFQSTVTKEILVRRLSSLESLSSILNCLPFYWTICVTFVVLKWVWPNLGLWALWLLTSRIWPCLATLVLNWKQNIIDKTKQKNFFNTGNRWNCITLFCCSQEISVATSGAVSAVTTDIQEMTMSGNPSFKLKAKYNR